jgi:hypothetical protein
MDDLLDILHGLQIYELKLASWKVMSYQGISLVNLIHLGAYELIELDIYMHMLLAMRW